jgi:hypothetical protein
MSADRSRPAAVADRGVVDDAVVRVEIAPGAIEVPGKAVSQPGLAT